MKPWKQLVIFHLIPIVLMLACIPPVFLWLRFNFPPQYFPPPERTPSYIDNFQNSPWYEYHFLNDVKGRPEIYVLGSSELTGGTEATPYNFIGSTI